MAAPKGNKYAEGNNGGRPPIYTSEDVEKVDCLIDDYFEYIKGESEDKEIERIVKDDEGNPKVVKETVTVWIRHPEPPTVTGLTLFIGFADKSTLYDYSKKEEFSHSIKRGLLKIEQYHEIKTSYGDKCTGNIFVLKNFGWKDKTEVMQTNVNLTPPTPEELKKAQEDIDNAI